jgi:hypothetical protein
MDEEVLYWRAGKNSSIQLFINNGFSYSDVKLPELYAPVSLIFYLSITVKFLKEGGNVSLINIILGRYMLKHK